MTGLQFCARTIEAALTTSDLFAITWWCSHDVSRSLADYKDLEYSLGLLDTENRVKPLGRRFAELVAEARNRPQPQARTVGVVVDVDERDLPLSRTALGPGGAIFEHWHELREQSVDVAVVTSKAAASPGNWRRGASAKSIARPWPEPRTRVAVSGLPRLVVSVAEG